MFNSSSLDLKELPFIESFIVEKGITSNNNSIAGKGAINFKVFYVKVEGLNNKLTIYNSSQNYISLNEKIHLNDKLKVYYRKLSNNLEMNLEIHQLEKGDNIIYSASEYQRKEKIGAYIALFGGILMIAIAIYQDKKHWKK